MDRYWENAGADDPPPTPASTEGTYPTDGYLPAAIAASTPGAWWYHQVTEEIRNAVIKLGGVPDFKQVDQLANAIIANVAAAVANASAQLAPVATTGNYNDLTNKPAIQAPLGFTPVQQGGGNNQAVNKVYIGWRSDASGVGVTIDQTDEGNIVFEPELQANIANLQGQINSVAGSTGNAWTPNNLQPMALGGLGNFIIVSNSLTAGQMIANPQVRYNGPTQPGTWLSCGQFSSGSDTFSLVVRIA